MLGCLGAICRACACLLLPTDVYSAVHLLLSQGGLLFLHSVVSIQHCTQTALKLHSHNYSDMCPCDHHRLEGVTHMLGNRPGRWLAL